VRLRALKGRLGRECVAYVAVHGDPAGRLSSAVPDRRSDAVEVPEDLAVRP
jgi:hypothetical protein